MNEQTIIKEAIEAHDDAARAQFVRDGSRDTGSCGGVMLGYRGNTRFAKALLAANLGFKSDGKVYVTLKHPEGVQSQHMAIAEKGYRAFADATIRYGIHPTEHRSYVD